MSKHAHQSTIALHIRPKHRATPSITGKLTGPSAGTVYYGHYQMSYHLPDGELTLIANHNQKHVQIIYKTLDAKKIEGLPGKHGVSIVHDCLDALDVYTKRLQSYGKLDRHQLQKKQILETGITKIKRLYRQERLLNPNDIGGREQLRQDLIKVIETMRDENRLLALSPVISEGFFGRLLYDTRQSMQNYAFDYRIKVTRADQMRFSPKDGHTFVWDSQVHVGANQDDIERALLHIMSQYDLNPAGLVKEVKANRFRRFEQFFLSLFKDGRDWVDYLALPEKPKHQHTKSDGKNSLTLSDIEPWYVFNGLEQIRFESIHDLMKALCVNCREVPKVKDLSSNPNGSYHWDKNTSMLYFKKHDSIQKIKVIKTNEGFLPLPDGADLITLSRIGSRHLYLPERVRLQLMAFVTRIPGFFPKFWQQLKAFSILEIYEDFEQHIAKGHPVHESPVHNSHKPNAIEKTLREAHILSEGQTIQDYVETYLNHHKIKICTPLHHPNPNQYHNPLHRSMDLLKHLAAFFVDSSEKHPITGTAALMAYTYGAMAVLTPAGLSAILAKVHLGFLILGIKPTQTLGHLMSHGAFSEAISSAITYWQVCMALGNADQVLLTSLEFLKEDPAELTIIILLALALGYGLTKAIPPLAEEMGEFALPNYLTLGAKGGAAIYDTIMHPGDDWLLGTVKWLMRCAIVPAKIILAPMIETYRYGPSGLRIGLKKSFETIYMALKQIIATALDLMLIIATIPFCELSAMFIHVPFRGITNLLAKTLATLGNIEAIGLSIRSFAYREQSFSHIPSFRPSPLYGFHLINKNPTRWWLINQVINASLIIPVCLMQLAKNILLLALDSTSIALRFGLILSDHATRQLALALSFFIVNIGKVSDQNFGFLFRALSKSMTHAANTIDAGAGVIKRQALKSINITRGNLTLFASQTPLKHEKPKSVSSLFAQYEKLHRSDDPCLMGCIR